MVLHRLLDIYLLLPTWGRLRFVHRGSRRSHIDTFSRHHFDHLCDFGHHPSTKETDVVTGSAAQLEVAAGAFAILGAVGSPHFQMRLLQEGD